MAALSPLDADPEDVARAIVAVVDAPFGKRPFRVRIDPAHDGVEEVNGVADRMRIFVHPTSPHCQCAKWSRAGDREADIAFGYPRPMIEFLFETTRTITQMMLSGTLDRYPGIRVIVPHAGACLPVLAERIELLMNAGPVKATSAPIDIRASLRRLHYDVAGAPVPELLGDLLQIADLDRLHCGSDWPFTPVGALGCTRGQCRVRRSAPKAH